MKVSKAYLLHVTIMALVYYFKSRLRNQCLWYADSFWSLVVFQQGGNNAWQSECGTVQRMAKLCFLFCRTVAAFQTVGLVSVEVGNGTYFQPAFLCFGIYLEIEAEGRREAHVTAAKAQDAVRQLQLLEQSFHVVQHFLVRLLAVFRLVDAHQLHFGELVQAVQAAYILAV